ncbi:hypothetical protein [Holdemanella porci]|nr:hypothetical protein [Holdemanella porci]
MTAKREYKEALNRLLTTYNSSDHSMSARRKFRLCHNKWLIFDEK